jgi:hypothetical protein
MPLASKALVKARKTFELVLDYSLQTFFSLSNLLLYPKSATQTIKSKSSLPTDLITNYEIIWQDMLSELFAELATQIALNKSDKETTNIIAATVIQRLIALLVQNHPCLNESFVKTFASPSLSSVAYSQSLVNLINHLIGQNQVSKS